MYATPTSPSLQICIDAIPKFNSLKAFFFLIALCCLEKKISVIFGNWGGGGGPKKKNFLKLGRKTPKK